MKINGLPVLGIVVAFIAFYLIGFLFYGLLFSELWMQESGYVVADFEPGSQMWMLLGIPQTLAQVVGLALVLKWRGWPNLAGALETGLILGFLIAVPFAAYQLMYSPEHSILLFILDSAHLVLGWAVSCIILTLMR